MTNTTPTTLEELRTFLDEMFAQADKVEQAEQEGYRLTDQYEQQLQETAAQIAELEASKSQCSCIDDFNKIAAQITALQEHQTSLVAMVSNSKDFAVQEIFKQVDILVPMIQKGDRTAKSIEKEYIATAQLKNARQMHTNFAEIQMSLRDIRATLVQYVKKYKRYRNWQKGELSTSYDTSAYVTAQGLSFSLRHYQFEATHSLKLVRMVEKYEYDTGIKFA